MIQDQAFQPGPPPQQAPRGINGGVNPLLKFRSNRQIEEDDAARKAAETPPETIEFLATSPLMGHIRRTWDRNKLSKQFIQQRLLDALRARRGVYSAAQITQMQQNGTMNFVWVDITETKCRAASAWIREVLLPVGERTFALQPSPLPDVPPELKKSIMQEALQKAKQSMVSQFQAAQSPQNMQQIAGQSPQQSSNPLQSQSQQQPQAQPTIPSRDEFAQNARDLADKMYDEVVRRANQAATKAASRMEDQIAERMAEGGWEKAIDEFIEDFVTYQAAFLEGPVYERQRRLQWAPGWHPIVINTPIQRYNRIDPFDVYPAARSKSCQDGDLVIRKRYQRHELYDCIGLDGYNDDAIRDALQAYSQGRLEGWLWTDAERERLTKETMYTFLSPQGVIDGLHYWGPVQGWMLIEWGIKDWAEIDPTRDYEVDAILVGQYVIKCQINKDPLFRRPYWSASYDAVPGALWGNSVPDLARTAQKMCNAAACALADNMGMASGPMTWVYADRFADGVQEFKVAPWEVYYMKSNPAVANDKPMDFFQPNSNAEELQAIIEKWDQRADDDTGIPRYTYGNEQVAGAADTATGLSMLMNNAAKGLRRAIGQVDLNIIQPSVYATFINEMLFNPDKSIKCDAMVVPRGATSILVKEANNQSRLQALQIVSGNPALAQFVGPQFLGELIREAMKALNVPTDDLPDEEEIAKQQEQQQAAAQAQAQGQAQAVQQQQQAQQQQFDAQQEQQQQQLQFQAQENQKDRDHAEALAGIKAAVEHAKSLQPAAQRGAQ